MTEVVSSTVNFLVEKLASLAVEEIQLVCGVKNDREKLKKTLETIQELLADAEQKQTNDKAVKDWLSSLKNFCYEADDVLDEFEATVLWRQARSSEHSTFKRKVRYLSSWMTNFIFQFKIAHGMKDLRNKLRDINDEKNQFQLSRDVFDKTIVPRRETYSFIPRSDVVGRNEENKTLIKLLIRSDDEAGRLGVVPIIGMGGLGKTTLAKLVYHDDEVNKNFEENKVWLSMPVVFEVEKIIRGIIQSLGHEAKSDTFEMLQNQLREIMENKKFLFVMDDVWEVERKDWVELRELLEGISEGSKVIVTSRDESIAKIMGTVPPIKLTHLSQEESLTLFMKCAFDPGQEKNHPDLMVISNEIVGKCMGNPLAVKTLGSLLYSRKDNRSDWEYVRDTEMWQLKNGILPSLRISYDLMPSYLKKCFAYCSIFPKGHVFSNLDLIQLWISNGLILSSRNNQELEKIGWQYLVELRSRSFFDIVHEDHPLLFFRMHDLIHELAILVAQLESSNMEVRVRDIPSMTRHILFTNPSLVPKDELYSCLSKLSGVHSIMFQEGSAGEFFLKMCISRFKRLRVLWLDGSYFDLLPTSVGGLKHLRFLTIRSNHNIKKLPKSVCELLNLQYLGLGGCSKLEELPANIKNLTKLRVLSITTKQQHFPEGGIGCLTSLQWLFIGECDNLETLFDDIQLLTSLRKLFIWGCPKLASLPQGIKNLKALEDLGIWGCSILKLPEGGSNEPCSMLTLQSFRFEKLPEIISFPDWLKDSASTLQKIIIKDCPKLRVLPEWLQNCSSLTTLKIGSCGGLSALPDGILRIATLTEVQIVDCGIMEEYRLKK